MLIMPTEETVNPEHRKMRAQVAANVRHHPDEPATVTLIQDFKEERLAEHIRKIIASAPPLTAEQKARLAAILNEVSH
jgi:hypothetical protein